MGAVAKYAAPKTAGELGRLIETFLMAEFAWGCSGGANKHGADLDVDLDDENVTIFVLPTDQAFAIKHDMDRLSDGYRLERLDAEEMKLVEAHRVARRRDRDGVGDGADVDGFQTEHAYVMGDHRLTVSVVACDADQWGESTDGLSAGWSVVRNDDQVIAVRLRSQDATVNRASADLTVRCWRRWWSGRRSRISTRPRISPRSPAGPASRSASDAGSAGSRRKSGSRGRAVIPAGWCLTPSCFGSSERACCRTRPFEHGPHDVPLDAASSHETGSRRPERLRGTRRRRRGRFSERTSYTYTDMEHGHG